MILLAKDKSLFFTLSLIAVIMIMLSFTMNSSINAQVKNEPSKFYKDDIAGFEINYPLSWKARTITPTITLGGVEISAPQEGFVDLFGNNAMVKIEASNLPSEKKTLELLTNYRLITLTNFMPGYVILESNSSNIAGMPAYRVVFKASVMDIGMGTHQIATEIWTINGDKWYDVLYVAPAEKYDKYLATAQKIMNSLKVS